VCGQTVLEVLWLLALHWACGSDCQERSSCRHRAKTVATPRAGSGNHGTMSVLLSRIHSQHSGFLSTPRDWGSERLKARRQRYLCCCAQTRFITPWWGLKRLSSIHTPTGSGHTVWARGWGGGKFHMWRNISNFQQSAYHPEKMVCWNCENKREKLVWWSCDSVVMKPWKFY
jgi:hypothetical protein